MSTPKIDMETLVQPKALLINKNPYIWIDPSKYHRWVLDPKSGVLVGFMPLIVPVQSPLSKNQMELTFTQEAFQGKEAGVIINYLSNGQMIDPDDVDFEEQPAPTIQLVN